MKPAAMHELSTDMDIVIDEAGTFYSFDTVASVMGHVQGMHLIRTVTNRYLDMSKINIYPATDELKTEFLLMGIPFPERKISHPVSY